MKFTWLAALAVLINPVPTGAEDRGPTITAVEEDWVVYIRNPDPAVTAPQIVNVISPVADMNSVFGIIELNHASQPSFHAGGGQVQAWNNDQSIDVKWTADDGALWRSYDKLEYTVRMEIKDGKVYFTLKNGRSKTWGKFATTGPPAWLHKMFCPISMAPCQQASWIVLTDWLPQNDITSGWIGAMHVRIG